MIVITSNLTPLSQQITAGGDNEDRDRGGMWQWKKSWSSSLSPARRPHFV